MSRPSAKKAKSSDIGPRFGVHMSVAGGIQNAFNAGIEVGCDCMQIFVKNQRQWAAPQLTREKINAYADAQRETGLSPVVAHASYLLNLASPEAAKRQRSIDALVDEHERCQQLGVDFLVFHPGAHMGEGMDAGIKRIARSLDVVSRKSGEGCCTILLETTAGQGSAIGYRFEHLRDILGQVKHPERFGACLDTCHLFVAGYDFRKPTGYESMMDELIKTIGVSTVRCIHVNDSKREAGSRVDRHEHIGEGKIGKSGIAHFVNDRRFGAMPMILETPEGSNGRGTDMDKVNLRRLRRMIRS